MRRVEPVKPQNLLALPGQVVESGTADAARAEDDDFSVLHAPIVSFRVSYRQTSRNR